MSSEFRTVQVWPSSAEEVMAELSHVGIQSSKVLGILETQGYFVCCSLTLQCITSNAFAEPSGIFRDMTHTERGAP